MEGDLDQIAVTPPRPQRRRTCRTIHGRQLVDDYGWLSDPSDPATMPHLLAENAWTDRVTAPLEPLRSELFEEIRRRTLEDDMSVPVRDGAWWYIRRTETGRSYPVHLRRADDGTGTTPTGPELLVLDPNALVAEGEYLGIGVLDVSPDGNWLAYAVDRDGDEQHDLRFRDLRTGLDSPEVIRGAAYGFAWAADSTTCWYTLQDDSFRPNRVVRHRVGTDISLDVEVFRDDDEHFHVSVAASRSRTLAIISADSAVTSESWLLDAHSPTAEPVVVVPREQDVEYSVAHHPVGLLVVSNHGGAEDFALWRAPLKGLRTAPRDAWDCLVPHSPGRRIVGVEAFERHAVVHGRSGGRTALWHLDPRSGDLRELHTDEEASTIGPGDNPNFDSSIYRLTYQSLTTPPTVFDEDLSTGERVLRKRLPVLDGFDASLYSSAVEWATSRDGTKVPISLVWRPDAVGTELPGPCVLYGYGSYEASMDPWFSVARLSLLDRGVTFAIAHVRGGGELGRHWYEDGKLDRKTNSFTDFVACAEHLVSSGRTSPELLAARGGSAGGLLVGAAANLAPNLFRAVVAEVPFVDPLTTLLDPSLPLTVIEWEEWGDPLHDAAAFDLIGAYSPYGNVADVDHPAVLATAGLHDPRVGFHEPAKWVARLRDAAPSSRTDRLDGRPVLLKVELGAGHGGPSGRYDAWRDEAFVLAFLLAAIVPEAQASPV